MKSVESRIERDLCDRLTEQSLSNQDAAGSRTAILSEMNEKLLVAGRLTRHDLLNKLSAAIGFVYLAKQEVEQLELDRDGNVYNYLRRIENVCDQMERILAISRAFENPGAEKSGYLEIEETILEAFRLVRNLDDMKIRIRCAGLSIYADSLLGRIFFNLFDNTIKHGGDIDEVRVYVDPRGNGSLDLVYEDNGVGISAGEKESVFLDGMGKGTGHGLYLVRRICVLYGWSVEETGEYGQGARFVISIPEKNASGEPNFRFKPSILN